jgi:HEAT repeat protein
VSIDKTTRLIEELGKDHKERSIAQKQLVEMGEIVVEPLIAVMLAKNGRSCWIAAQTLGKLKDPRSIQPLISVLLSENQLLGSAAATALSSYGDDDVAIQLVKALPDARIIVQQTIIKLLQELNDTRVVEALLEILQLTSSPTIRHSIINVLGTLGDKRAIPIIRAFENDENHHVREWTTIALEQLENAADNDK